MVYNAFYHNGSGCPGAVGGVARLRSHRGGGGGSGSVRVYGGLLVGQSVLVIACDKMATIGSVAQLVRAHGSHP